MTYIGDHDTQIRPDYMQRKTPIIFPDTRFQGVRLDGGQIWCEQVFSRANRIDSYFGRYGVCENRARLDGKPNNWKRKMPQVYKMAHTGDTDVEIMQITWLGWRVPNCAVYRIMIGVDWSLFFLNFAYFFIFCASCVLDAFQFLGVPRSVSG